MIVVVAAAVVVVVVVVVVAVGSAAVAVAVAFAVVGGRGGAILVGKSSLRGHLRDLSMDGKMILKQVFIMLSEIGSMVL
jgi:hypothetical protein